MRAATVRIPGWDEAPLAAWRGEGKPFADAGGTFRRIELNARMVAAERDLSIEMLEDSASTDLGALSNLVQVEIGKAIAEAIDFAALMGKGKENEPLGVYNTEGIDIDHLNGALADYDPFLDMIYVVEKGNFAPNAAIYSPRVKRDLSKLETGISGDKTKLEAPEDVKALRRLVTNQVPEDLGSGSDETLIALGQWDRLVVALRPDVGIRAQVDPYSKGSSGMVTVRAYARADVAFLDKGAFAITDQIA